MNLLTREMPLSLKVPLLAAMLMVLVGLAASRQVLSTLGSVQDARLQELVRMHVDGLSVALGPQVVRRDVWEVFDTLDRAMAGSAGQRIILTVVTDTEGNVLAASNPRLVPVDSTALELFEGAQNLSNLRVDDAKDTLRVVAPLEYQGRNVGQIMTQLDASDLVAQRRETVRYLLLGNALATGGIAIFGYFAMRRMFRPILRLARHISETAGSPRPIAQSDLPHSDAELARLFNTYNAMTGAVEAKAEIERRLSERERYVSLGRLSSSLAHEINNPLGGLLNATDAILQYADRPAAVRQSAELIQRGLKHLRDVARVTLDQHRIDRSGAKMSREDFEDLHLLFGPEASRLDQNVEWLVEAGDEELMQLPAVKVRQIVLNLLLNASAAAGKNGEISLVVSSGRTGLSLKIRDNGPGMSEAALKRLLSDESFQPGGGVGLRIVRELVAGMGGELTHSRCDGITELEITFPAREAALQ
jgi:signal transduction histidine kinase